jgi:tetratricopeptide (TPR) repeat protein
MRAAMNRLDQAFDLLRAHKPREAEALLTDAAREAAERFGADSAEHAEALFELAHVMLALGDFGRAADLMKQAAEIPTHTSQARRAQLNYQGNLGEVLQRLGRLGEARSVLEENLRGRAEVWGEGTEGYAVGQVSLADVLFWQGELERAEELIEEAAGVLWHAHSGRVVVALALRAAIRAARYGDERPLLEHLDALSPQLQAELVAMCLDRAERDPPPPALIVLQELRERLEDEEALRPMLPQVVAAKAEVARRARDHQARLEAIGWLASHFEQAGDDREVLRARLGLALARDEAGDAQGAEQAYRDAVGRAEALGDEAVRALVLRNAGLFFGRHEQPAEADRLLVDALASAERAGDKLQLGVTLVARGIFLQHQKRGDEARPMLERALEALPAGHPDVAVARIHLEALARGAACGCGERGNALAKALEDLVRPKLPEGLLASIRMDPSAGFSSIQVGLSREPSDEERKLLGKVIDEAISELRARLRRQEKA